MLPLPRKKATELKKFAARTINAWHEKFGDSYQLLNLGFNYLKNLKKIDFVEFSHQTNAERLHAQREQEKKQIILNKRCAEYEKQMNGLLLGLSYLSWVNLIFEIFVFMFKNWNLT